MAASAPTEMDCPVCDGNIPLQGDEAAGEGVYCGYCGVMSNFVPATDDEEASLEADY
jgi:hypothetical protein